MEKLLQTTNGYGLLFSNLITGNTRYFLNYTIQKLFYMFFNLILSLHKYVFPSLLAFPKATCATMEQILDHF